MADTITVPSGADDSGMPDLFTQLHDPMILREEESNAFLPANCLRDVLSKEAVRVQLEEQQKEHPGNFGTTGLESLVKFVCEKAPKTFATLVWSDNISRTNQFYVAGFDDTVLPVIQVDNKMLPSDEKFSEVVDSVFKYNPRKWNRRQVTNFYSAQWRFLAPIFSKDQFQYRFHQQIRMPFIKKFHHGGTSGAFGMVEEWIIHRHHLDPSVVRAIRFRRSILRRS